MLSPGRLAKRSEAADAAVEATAAAASECSRSLRRSARRPAACRARWPGRFRLTDCTGVPPSATGDWP
eukprot:1932380-Alexandrium_andersonii.AAC.1